MCSLEGLLCSWKFKVFPKSALKMSSSISSMKSVSGVSSSFDGLGVGIVEICIVLCTGLASRS